MQLCRLLATIRLFRRRHDGLLNLPAEQFIALVAVQRRGARRVVRMGAVHENVGGRNLECLRDLLDRRVQQVAGQHEYVACDDRHFSLPGSLRLLNHDRDGPEFALLTLHLVRHDAPADDHVVGGFEFHGRRPDAESWRLVWINGTQTKQGREQR